MAGIEPASSCEPHERHQRTTKSQHNGPITLMRTRPKGLGGILVKYPSLLKIENQLVKAFYHHKSIVIIHLLTDIHHS